MDKKKKQPPAYRRIMDIAWMRDKHGNIYHGEALTLALLLHTRGKTRRGREEMEQIQKMLDDVNLDQ